MDDKKKENSPGSKVYTIVPSELSSAMKTLDRVKAVSRDVMENKSNMAASCKSHGLSYIQYRRIMIMIMGMDLAADKNSVRMRNEAINSLVQTNGITTLYSLVFDVKNCAKLCDIVPLKADDYVEEALLALESVKPTYAAAIRSVYVEEKPRGEVVKELNVTRERVRQILNGAIRILKQPKYANILLYGTAYEDMLNAERETVRREIEENLACEIEAMQEFARKKLEETRMANEMAVYQDEYHVSVLPSEAISELDISMRGKNCLRRAGVFTVGELIKLDYDDVRRIRSMGDKTIEDISTALHAAGYRPMF